MPRQEGRSRTVREEATLAPDREVTINSQKRFFSSRGNDSATRTARALIDATSSVVNLKQTLDIRSDNKGRERAVQEASGGEWQDQYDKNKGYMAAWAQMDAEKELGRLKEGLPKYLDSIDAHKLTEQQFVDAIDEWVQPQLEGIEETGVYGRAMAPGVLAIYEDAVTAHKDQQLEEIKAEQREDTAEVAQNRYKEAGGVWDHEYIAAQTHMFETQEESRRAYWTQTFAGAMFNADITILDEALEQFPDGSSTGKHDPAFAVELEKMRTAVLRKSANAAAEMQAKEEAARDQAIFDTQVEILRRKEANLDTREQEDTLRELGASFDQLKSAVTYGQGQRTHLEKRSAPVGYVTALWKQIYEGGADNETVMFAHSQGYLGIGPQADALAKQMFQTVGSTRAANQTAHPDVPTYRSQLVRTYNPARGGVLGKLDPTISSIQIQAIQYYNVQVSKGVDPLEAYEKATARFDGIYSRVDSIKAAQEKMGLDNATQTQFIHREVVTTESLKAVAAGDVEFIDMFAGVPLHMVDQELVWARKDKTLTDAEIEAIMANYN